ncbi:recombinase family protein [Amycolatopsis balhimycina DSM 5908]|uniref:Recombinase family protein n=1 Tax=Amycolatopsis balhimycina DSM 5908 TaxID=1081091 RepID=A0A428WTF6_AMYBA|nr:recombinase family protein [Amycolatopsis balhimycina]RSM46347.1 recombinase family protein [Amycolatopsis balhimycina DSM 5908]
MGDDDKVSAGQGAAVPLVLDSYGRLSKVPETGELEKVEDQHADNRSVIDRAGGVLGLELSDGLSAWKKGVRRPGWERLLERVQAGVSDGCVVWHTDRLFRQPPDLEKLIELAENGYKVYSARGERDLADPDDRFILRIEVAHAARSSDDTSRRIKRRFETFRKQGRTTGGPRRFGFPGKDATWTPGKKQTEADRPEVSAELVATERQALRDAAKLLLSEDGSMGKVVDLWNAAGVRTAAGREWVHASATATMQRPALGGYVAHNGIVAGRMEGEPILDQRTYDRLQAMFAGRKRGRVAGQSHVGTGILRCGVCGRKLTARTVTGKTYPDETVRATYFCAKQRRGCGRVFIDRRAVDAELLTFTVERLSDERHTSELAELKTRAHERLAAVRAEIEDVEKLQAGLSARVGARKMTLDAFDVANEPLVADLARLIAERDTLSAGVPEGPTEAASAATLVAEWNGGDVAEKRGMLTRAIGADRLTVLPGSRTGKRVFDRTRLKLLTPEAFAKLVAGWNATQLAGGP